MINLRLIILQNKFNSLAILLNNLHHCGSTLRSILVSYEQYWCHEHVLRGYSPETDESYSLDELTNDQYFQFTKESHKKVVSCLEFLIHTFGNDTFVTRPNHHPNVPGEIPNDELSGERQLSLNELYELAEKCVTEAEVLQSYTLRQCILLNDHLIGGVAVNNLSKLCSSPNAFPEILGLVHCRLCCECVRYLNNCEAYQEWEHSKYHRSGLHDHPIEY